MSATADPTYSAGHTDPHPGSPWWADRAHPVWTAAALVAVPVLLTVVVGLVSAGLSGGGDQAQLVGRLAAVLLVAALAVAVVARERAWVRVGAAGRRSWSHLGLLIVPALVAVAPIAMGFSVPAASTVLVLALGYVGTGVFEELWHRGVVLDALRSLGLRRSALVGGALFGASHLANVVFGQSAAVSLAQAVGAFCFGVGFGIFRWRTHAVWLLAAIHAVSDLMFKVTGLHGGLLWAFLVGNDILMLLWGMWCLRGASDEVTNRASDRD